MAIQTGDMIGLLQAVLVLLSAWLVSSQIALREFSKKDSDIGRWGQNAFIGVIGALWGFLMKSMENTVELVISTSGDPNIAPAVEPLTNFTLVTGLLVLQMLVRKRGTGEDKNPLVDWIATVLTTLVIFYGAQFVGISV